ncbi:MAG: GNAT family N-acetyltransferase [Anaerolineaceae bacterium]|nr:GNAT family N-acetyltransferase [Anaerolineaceae bacterium]
MKSKIHISEIEEKEFAEFLKDQIKKFNNETSPYHLEARKPGAVKTLNLIMLNEKGEMIGGLAGSTYWDWLDVDDFFIPETLRGQGIGADLLKNAEGIAIERGCKRSYLSTFGFQARSFYEKQGYYVVGTLKDYPPGSAMYWMRKDFEEDS